MAMTRTYRLIQLSIIPILSCIQFITSERRLFENIIGSRNILLADNSSLYHTNYQSNVFSGDVASKSDAISRPVTINGSDDDRGPLGYPLGSAGIPRQTKTTSEYRQFQNYTNQRLMEDKLKRRRKQVFAGNPYVFDQKTIHDTTIEKKVDNNPWFQQYPEHVDRLNYMEEDARFGIYRDDFEPIQEEEQFNEVADKLDSLRRQGITPVVYRFFARSQAAKAVAASITAGATGGSISYILLVPNVDHWKVTGTELASRGYNVIAVGPQIPDDEDEDMEEEEDGISIYDIRKRYSQGPALVLQLMDALRWTKVVLVGCDSESLMAIQAAVTLSSSTKGVSSQAGDRQILGLILCGNLEETEEVMHSSIAHEQDDEEFTSYYYNRRLSSSSSDSKGRLGFLIDRFLEENLRCPFTVVWDGDGSNHAIPAATIINARKILIEDLDEHDDWYRHLRHRSLLIGGGSAPHRRRPEYFAWVVSRFVEEQIAPAVEIQLRHQSDGRNSAQAYQHTSFDIRKKPFSTSLRLPEIIAHEESFVVFGRVAATALFYAMALKVLLFQYENLRIGIDTITLFRQTTVGTIRRISLRILSALLLRPIGMSSSDDSNNITGSNVDMGSTREDDQSTPSNRNETEISTVQKPGGFSKFRSVAGNFFKSIWRLKRVLPFVHKGTDTSSGDGDNSTIIEDDFDLLNPKEDRNGTIDLESTGDEEQIRVHPTYWLDHVIT